MMTPVHIAVSYAISKGFTLWGYKPNNLDSILTILAGNILDLDYLIGRLFGRKGEAHHSFITHTPIFAFISFLALTFFFKKYLSFPLILIMGIALFFHLVLDNLSYWLYKLGFKNESSIPQINWFFPLTKPVRREIPEKKVKEIIKDYFVKTKAGAIVELSLLGLSSLIFIKL